MHFEKLQIIEAENDYEKLRRGYKNLDKVLSALEKKQLSFDKFNEVNSMIIAINDFNGEVDDKARLVKNTYHQIVRIIVQDLKMVPKNHYRTIWISLGIVLFGIPVGVTVSVIAGNLGLLGLGLPIGLAIGAIIGRKMDKKAAEEERQIDMQGGFQ